MGEVGVRAQPRGSGWSGGCHPSLFCLEELWDRCDPVALQPAWEVTRATVVCHFCSESGWAEGMG